MRTSIAPFPSVSTRAAKRSTLLRCTISRMISHEVAFDFARAFDLDQQLIEQDPTPMNHLNLEEAALTANQFDVCLAQAASIKDSDLTPPELMVRDALLLACQYASGKKPEALATAASLSGRVKQMPAQVWDFAGTRHYIRDVQPLPGRKRCLGQTSPQFAKG